ncbi:MAG: 6-carboxytetrahydropterin synthase QueD [Vulcanimicrobiaceae bacterium]
MTVEIRKHFRFEAAHVLPFHPGKCARLHGHSYRLEVAIAGALQTSGAATGMVADFDDIGAAVRPRVIERLDHASLNDLIENPTAERIALWIWSELAEHVPQLVEIVVWETQTACAIVRGDDARAR